MNTSQHKKNPTRKDMRFDREAKALQKNLQKRKHQQEQLKQKKLEKSNG